MLSYLPAYLCAELGGSVAIDNTTVYADEMFMLAVSLGFFKYMLNNLKTYGD